jgi:hypothetical protein
MILRDLMVRIDGFCEVYEHYGLEDKDLAIQLSRLNAKAGFTQTAAVKHMDVDTAMQLYNKQFKAAEWSAPILYRRYPQEFKALPHGAIEPKIHPNRALLYSFIRLLLNAARPAMVKLYDSEQSPYLLWNISRLGLMIAGYLDGAKSRTSHNR